MNFACPLCAYTTDSITLLHVHCINAHPKEFFTCPWCTVPFGTLRVLQMHAKICSALDKNEPREGEVNTVLVNGDKCLVCEGRYNSSEAVIEHYKEQHLNISYICSICGMYFQYKSIWELHYAAHRANTKSSVSLVVPISSPDKVRTRQSKRTASAAFGESTDDLIGIAGPSRAVSTLNYGSVEAMKNIANYSTADRRLSMKKFSERICMFCELQFGSTEDLAVHFQADHKTVVFSCDTCGDAFYAKASLTAHMKRFHPRKENRVHHPRDGQVSGLQNSQTSTPDAQNQKIFACFLCEFEAFSRESVQMHVAEVHTDPTEPNIKSEMGIDADSTSMPTSAIAEEANAERPEPAIPWLDLILWSDEE